MASSPWVTDATDATFDQEVIERSKKTPVVVDFWAAWCAPCRMLGPALEKAVADRAGKVWLVKVNIEENPAVAAELGVQGIPAVKAFVDGRLAGEFAGARDRRFVEGFLDRLVPAAEERGLAEARTLLERGLPELVADALGPALESVHHRDAALLLLARARAASGEADGAGQALAEISEGSPEAEQAAAMRLELELLGAASGLSESEVRSRVEGSAGAPDDLWTLAGFLLSAGRVGEALEALLEILKADRGYRDDGARRAMLAVFDRIGQNHELANDYRRQMQIYM